MGLGREILTLRRNQFTQPSDLVIDGLPALKQHRGVLVEVLIASFFVQLFGLMNPLLIQQVIDKAIIKSSRCTRCTRFTACSVCNI